MPAPTLPCFVVRGRRSTRMRMRKKEHLRSSTLAYTRCELAPPPSTSTVKSRLTKHNTRKNVPWYIHCMRKTQPRPRIPWYRRVYRQLAQDSPQHVLRASTVPHHFVRRPRRHPHLGPESLSTTVLVLLWYPALGLSAHHPTEPYDLDSLRGAHKTPRRSSADLVAGHYRLLQPRSGSLCPLIACYRQCPRRWK